MTDLEIIKRIRAGNTKAYAELVERYEGNIYTALYRCLQEEDKAIKLTEEIFIQSYLHLGNVAQEADYITVLFRITVNKLKPVCTTQESIKVWSGYEQIQQLELTPRQVLLLRSIYGLNYEQIAHKLNMDPDAIAAHLAAAREKITDQRCCGPYRQKLQAYADNELMRMERMEVEVHLEGCQDCVKFYEDIEQLFPGNFFAEMSGSVSPTVVSRIQEEFDDEGESPAESKRESMTKRLEKNKNLYTWVIVLCVLLFSACSWLFSFVAGDRLATDSHPDTSSGASSQITDGSEFSQILARSVREANAVFVQFGVNRVGVTEKPMILMFADYIAEQPSVEYQGMIAADRLGHITFEPKSNYTITITSTHHLLVDDGQQVWEIQTTRDELLNIFHILGL